MRRFPVSFILGVAFAFALFGCGKEQPNTQTGPSAPGGVAGPASSTIPADELDRVEKGKKKYRLALIVKTRNNPFFEPMIRAFEQEAWSLGREPEVQAPAQE